MNNESFSYNELILPYLEWKELSKQRKKELHQDVYKWLKAWELHDLFNSPIDDDKRRFIRYGHFVGWFAK